MNLPGSVSSKVEIHFFFAFNFNYGWYWKLCATTNFHVSLKKRTFPIFLIDGTQSTVLRLEYIQTENTILVEKY